MAQVKTTKKGFELTDSVMLKGKNLTCELDYEITADTEVNPKAGYFDKFVAYFAQEAAAKWNQAAVRAQKEMQSEFDSADKEMGKFVANVAKYNIKDPEKTIKEQEDKYSAEIKKKLHDKILKKVGNNLVEDAKTSAAKRMGTEGKALKKSKAKIAFKIGKIVVKVAAVAAAAVVTAATGGAGAPLLIAAVGWLALSAKTVKGLVDAGKDISKLVGSLKKDVTQMEKMLAELDTKFSAAVKFARNLESKADLMEMESDKLKASIKEAFQTLADVNPESKKFSTLAKSLEKDLKQLETMTDDIANHRAYAPALKSAFDEFRKVKNEASWGAKLEKASKVATVCSAVASGFQSLAKGIKAAA